MKRFQVLRQRYPTLKALVLPVLWMIQEQYGWISPEAMKYVAGLLKVPVSHVYGVVTFYTMFNTNPVGRHHLEMCTNVSCMLRGADRLIEHTCRRLGIRTGETTADGKFTVSEAECLGSCGTAPMMQVNHGHYYENLLIEELDRLLERWSA